MAGELLKDRTSVVAVAGQPGYLHYVASKGAELAMTKGLAKEVGRHGVRARLQAETAGVKSSELDSSRPPGRTWLHPLNPLHSSRQREQNDPPVLAAAEPVEEPHQEDPE